MTEQFEITEIKTGSSEALDRVPDENEPGQWVCDQCDHGSCPCEHFTVSVNGKPHSDYDNFKCPQCDHEWQIISPDIYSQLNTIDVRELNEDDDYLDIDKLIEMYHAVMRFIGNKYNNHRLLKDYEKS